MKFLFNYTFYFGVKIHKKKEGISPFNGVLLLSFIQTIYLFEFLYTCFYFADYKIHLSKYLLLSFGIVIFCLNYLFYRNKYDYFETKWGNEAFFAKFYKTMMVIVFFVLSAILMLFIPKINY